MPAKNVVKEYHENSYYHLYNRGVAKQEIFLDSQDYKTFLSYLKLYLSPLNQQGETLRAPLKPRLNNFYDQLKLIAYCLMPNHFHLQVWQKDEFGINKFIQSLATKYSLFFNRKYDRVGTIFQGPYKAVLVSSEPQLIYLSKYIHRNPLEILSKGTPLEDYKYSSYGNYLRLFTQTWLDTEDILDLFSKTDPKNTYRAFVEEEDERDLLTIKPVVIEEV